MIIAGLFASCKPENEPPVPALEIFPRMGDSLTVFHFDASKTSDRRSYALSLEYRWDWDGDQSWDTDFSTRKEEVRRFRGSGYHKIRMQVIDHQGLTAEIEDSILLIARNPFQDSLVDPRDGKVYRTARINGRWVMTENLAYGVPIPDSADGLDNGVPEYFHYENDPDNQNYGGLYTWNETMNYGWNAGPGGICPPGWHVPSTKEWKQLLTGFPDHRADLVYYLGPDAGSGFNLEFFGQMVKDPSTGLVGYSIGSDLVGYWCSDPPARGTQYPDSEIETVRSINFQRYSWLVAAVPYRWVNPGNPVPIQVYAKYIRCFRDEE
ncbi:MAG: FISUMP domain-containing protein [Bacteroidales bacterium]